MPDDEWDGKSAMQHKSLVTGGCGFMGRHLVEVLRARGDAVRVLDLRPWPGEVREDIEIISGSITDPVAVRRAMENVDRVFHLAANPNLWAPDPAQFNEVNYLGTCRMLEEAGRHSLERFVYTSTESILKSARARRNSHRALIDETVRLRIDDMPGPYCRSKFRAEEAAHAAAASGLPVVIVNPTMPLGPGDLLQTPPTKMLLGFVNGTTPAYLDCEFNLVDARDAAMGHLLAAERGRIGERYILGNENLSLSHLLGELSRLTGLPMPKWKVPYGIAYLSALISEAVADITKKPPVAPVTGVRLARTSMAFDCSKARRELGWQTRSLTQTLTDTLIWLSQAGLLKRQIALTAVRG
jgi:dihydroflavonol-4-reductase